MRERLWPDFSRDEVTPAVFATLTDRIRKCVIVAANHEMPIGFIEASLHEWAEGCETSPVGYIEGWYVEPAYRRNGVGRQLVAAAEEWAISRGCTEMGSDVELHNELSQKAHEKLGYAEANRLVAYARKLR